MSGDRRSSDGAPAPRETGAIIGDKYRVLRVIAHGARGVVYEAEHTWTERRVALTTRHLDAGEADGNTVTRMLQEVKRAAKLVHPGIVEITDMGRDPEDNSLFIVEALLEGEDLQRRIDRKGPLSPATLLRVLGPVMEALAFAHDQGVLHGALEPSNIFLAASVDGEPTPKLIAFGASKLDGPTAPCALPSYLSPEQLHGEPIDARSDVWSLGVVMYEALTGHLPFGGGTAEALAARIAASRPRPIERLSPGVPAALATAILRALEPDRDARFPTVKALHDACVESARPENKAPVRFIRHADSEPPPSGDQTLIDDNIREQIMQRMLKGVAETPPWSHSVADELTNELAVSERMHDEDLDPLEVLGALDTLVMPIPRDLPRKEAARRDVPRPPSEGGSFARARGVHPAIVPPAPRVPSPPPSQPGSPKPPGAAPAPRPPMSSTSQARSVVPVSRRVRMGLVPVPAGRREELESIAAIERALDGRWSLERFPSYATLVDALTEDDIELAWLPPVAYIRARRLGPLHLLLTLERAGLPSYGSALIASEASGVKSLPEVTGKRVAWVDVWSAAGYLMPRGVLRAAGLDPARAFGSQAFVGSHGAVLEALESGRADVGATFCSLSSRGELVAAPWSDRKGIRPIAFSGAIPGDTVCASGAISAAEACVMVEPLITFSSSDQGASLFRRVFGASRFASVDPSYYEVLETVLEDDLRRGR